MRRAVRRAESPSKLTEQGGACLIALSSTCVLSVVRCVLLAVSRSSVSNGCVNSHGQISDIAVYRPHQGLTNTVHAAWSDCVWKRAFTIACTAAMPSEAAASLFLAISVIVERGQLSGTFLGSQNPKSRVHRMPSAPYRVNS